MEKSFVKTLNCSGCCGKCQSEHSNAYGGDGLAFYGQHHNAGGYGLWCNQACAARKDADRAASSKEASSTIEAIKQLAASAPDSGSNNTLMYIGIGAGVILILGGLAIYIIRKKK